MPDLGNLLNSTSMAISRCSNLSPVLDPCDSTVTLGSDAVFGCDWDRKLRVQIVRDSKSNTPSIKRRKKALGSKSLDDYVKAWMDKKIQLGVSTSRCFLPFLVGAPKLVDCLVCHCLVHPGDEVCCSIRGCPGVYHLKCAENSFGFSKSRKFKCPQHACFLCKNNVNLRCVRCMIASHNRCAPWSMTQLKNRGHVVCWRHPTDWWRENEHEVPTTDIEVVFSRLPLPYTEEEFSIDPTWKDEVYSTTEPPLYVHIKRNMYLVKKKRDNLGGDIGCRNCSSTTCDEDCVCRVQYISCSKACHCSASCTNRPFRKDKKIKLVKTEFCGWGVEASESINKGDFVIEYIGEVIDDALCEQRLWDMKYSGVQNFYLCEIRKDFTIDATFKGNLSRFLNHSCDPNCILEKWQVEGETRVGVFADRDIEVGEPLTYNYRFEQFGAEVKCRCGAVKCQGYLGSKRKTVKGNVRCWGTKRQRSTTRRSPTPS